MIPEIPEDVMKRINELRKDQMTPEDRDLIQKHEAAILAMTSEQRFELCLNGAKEYQLSLKSYFKEHAPAAVDEHGEMDIVKCREHLESLAKRKDLTDYEVVLVTEHSQVGRAYCTLCGEWTRQWISFMDEVLYPPLCDSCWEKPDLQEIIKRVDPTGVVYRIKK